ncbi:MAG: hypothetical protein M5U26_21940 [Planctomycetota bacterium]|nr:hypothetical protein [Planctomycetota bacterium]
MALQWLKKLWPGKGASASPATPAGNRICCVCGQSEIRIKQLIALPGDQFICAACCEKLAGTFGAGGAGGFTTAIQGPCSCCGRDGGRRPPVARTKTGLICKECVRLLAQMAYEREKLPPEEYQRRRKLWAQQLCYFCGKDKAAIKGAGMALLCYKCYDAMARIGNNEPLPGDLQCDLCMKKINGGPGQMGIQGGVICAECLARYEDFKAHKD